MEVEVISSLSYYNTNTVVQQNTDLFNILSVDSSKLNGRL